MHDNPLYVFILWAALHALLGWWELRVRWPAAPRPCRLWEARLSRLLFLASCAWPWIWLTFAVVRDFRRDPMHPLTFESLAWFAGAMAFRSAAGVLRARAQRRAAADADPNNLIAAVRGANRDAHFCLAFLGVIAAAWVILGYSHPLLWFCVLLAAILLKAWKRHCSLQRGFDFDPCPLQDEMIELGRKFGANIDQVRICTARSDLNVELLATTTRFSSNKPVHLLPLRNLTGLNPSTLMALLCLKWAKKADPESPAAAIRATGSCGQTAMGCMFLVCFWPFLSLIMFVTFSAKPEWQRTVFYSELAAIAAIAFVLIRSLGALPTRGEALESAFEVWRTGDPHEERTAEQFARAYAEYAGFIHAVRSPWLLSYRLRLDAPYVRFLKKHDLTHLLAP